MKTPALSKMCLAVAVASTGLAGASLTHAQTTSDANDAVVLENVIVTAQRMEQTANDVGMDIQAYGGDRLETLRINNVEDLTALVPSFTLAQSYQGVPTYTLRGIGFNTINMSATSTVGTYVDEVAYPYPIMNSGPMFDLQRVEVLKGPQGTLFGRNTTAGLINLVTNKPGEEFEALLRAEVGNYDTTNYEGMISSPLGDRAGVRVAFRQELSGEGWQESNARDETLGEVDRWGARAIVTLNPVDALSIDLAYNGWKNNSDNRAAQAIAFTPATAENPFNAPGLADYLANNKPDSGEQADWAPTSTRGVDQGTGLGMPGDLAMDASFNALSAHISLDVGDTGRIVSLTAYQDLERDGLTDFSGVPYEILMQDLHGTIESFSQELRFEGSTDRTNWLVGAYYANDEMLDSNRTMLGENANVGTIRFYTSTLLETPFNSNGYTPLEASQAFRTYQDRADIESTSWSIFGNLNWELSDTLALTTGLRYTEDSQEYAGCSRDFNGNMLPNVNVTNRALFFQAYGAFVDQISQGECNTFDPESLSFGLVESELDEDNVAWRVALDWSVTDDTMVYASLSQGAKSGVTPVNAANISTQNAPVGQEKLLAYELGFKASLLENSMQWNASAFYYDYEDKQLSVYFADPIYTTLSRLANVPESIAYGLDTELTWRMSRSFTAIASATLLQTEVQGYMGIDAAGQPADFDGAEFLYSPEASGAITLLYERDLTQSLGLSAHVNSRYQTESFANLEASDDYAIDAFTVVNAGISIHSLDHTWDLSLWGNNLTDEYYWLTVTQNANTVFRFPGKTRTFGATFTYRF